jgi:hypothetical protein
MRRNSLFLPSNNIVIPTGAQRSGGSCCFAAGSVTSLSRVAENANSYVYELSVASIPVSAELTSQPERTWISYFALRATTTYAALRRVDHRLCRPMKREILALFRMDP